VEAVAAFGIMSVSGVAGHVTEALRGQPLALALIVTNGLFIGLVIYPLVQVNAGLERRDALINDLIKMCGQHERTT
jgi:uncharacterized membrane protein